MSDPNNPCRFCSPREVTGRNELAYCERDSYPVSPGHSLIIPLRHCANFFDLTSEEVTACMELLAHQRLVLDDEFSPDGYNVGFNSGAAAGQRRRCDVSYHAPSESIRKALPKIRSFPTLRFMISRRTRSLPDSTP